MAQLELSVVLNLANFRTQLGKLAQASAAYYYPINLTIDKQAFKKQLAALGNIKPVIKIEDSQLDGARARIATLNKSLATLRRVTSTAIEIKVKYKEEGLPAAGTGAVGRAITGRAGGEEALANKSRGELQKLYGLFREANLRVGELSRSLGESSAEEIRQSLVPAFSDSGEEAVNGLAIGLKDPSSKISKAAKRLTVITIQDVKKGFGIASPSRVFKEIGKDLVAGLEIGFEDFNELRAKMVGKMRELVAVMRMEAAKVSGVSGMGGKPISAQEQFRQFLQQQQASRVRGSRAYTSPIGPLPVGSSQPYAQGTRGQFGYSGYEPRMVSRLYTGTPQFPSSGMMGPLSPLGSMGQFPIDPMLAVGGASAMGQKVAGPYPWSNTTRSARGGYIPGIGSSLQFPMSGMMYPSSPVQSGQSSPFSSPVQSGQSSRLASPLGPGYLAVGKGLAGIESAYGQAKGFLNTNKFPAAGAIAGLGSEFGNAIKQVLLFGTAYKALAFLTSLPGEAFEAAKGLATYKNQLQAVTAESGTFEQSFAFVDGLAARFNVPLDSARQGFIKLYASMEPAGFDQGQIEGLFTGISKASAAFGLSADKVDRVNYAFAQMASKGQIMSEELKGQLGDVLPGALGLFAEAAQMSIPEFSKAMEDGAFKGKAMEQVLGNVSILLNTKFGPAAEGAAKTLQGAVNQIQNNLSLMYQSFAPIVDGVAAAFGPQVNSLIKDVTDTVKVLTTTLVGGGDGFDTLSPRAQAFYAAVQTLEPALRQAGAALTDLGSRLAALAPYFVQVLASVISFASSPLARAALMAALAIGTLTAAMKLLEVTGIKAVLKSIYTFIGTLTTGIPVACGIARVAVIGLKLAITGLFVGAVLIGLDFLVGKLLRIGDAANDSAKDLRGMVKELDRMAGAGDLEGLTGEFLSAKTRLATARKANQQALSDLRAAKDLPERDDEGRRINLGKSLLVKSTQAAVDKTFGEVIARQAELTQATTARDNAVALKERQDAAAEEEAKKGLQKIDLSGGDAAKTKDKQKYVSDMAKLLQQEMQQKINAISQDASISDREREIQAAATRYDYELLMNKAEYNAGINDENKKDILTGGSI
jgi:tape measure domain-containing protein